MIGLHGLALFALWASGGYPAFKLVAFAVILGSFWWHLYVSYQRSGGFVSPTTPLVYRKGLWHFTTHAGKKHIFDQHRIILQAGIFFVMVLSSMQSRHKIVVFYDQIQEEDFKWLKLLENINKDPHVRK